MIIIPPDNCISPSSRRSCAFSYVKTIVEWSNLHPERNKPVFFWNQLKPRIMAAHKMNNEAAAENRMENFWKAKISDHVTEDSIFFPAELNQENEGSRLAFLDALWAQICADGKYREGHPVLIDFQNKFRDAVVDSEKSFDNGGHWNISIEDVVRKNHEP